MSLVPDYGDSDDDQQSSAATSASDHSDEDDKKISIASPACSTSAPAAGDKLPVPGFLNKLSATASCASSVFANPFAAAEHAKQSALEKHVKMVDGPTAMTINGKKVCWNYRKGRCRFGHNCKYAHDSDLQKSTAQPPVQELVCQSSNKQNQHAGKVEILSSGYEDPSEDTAEGSNVVQKRKRPGLSQGLQPGKKVLKQYYRMKDQH